IDEWLLERRCARRANFLAAEILLVGHYGGGLFRELEPRRQFRLVGLAWWVIERAPVDVLSDATGRPGCATTVEMMKAPILRKQREIGGGALEVVVVHFYEQYMRGRSHQPHHDFRDDAALTQAAKHCVEEIAAARVGAGYNLAVAGHDLKLLHVGDLKPKVVRGYAESAGADRPADRQECIGNHRHGEFLGVRSHEDRAPLGAGPYLRGPARARFDDADGIQAAGVDDHAARDLGLPKKRMCLDAHRDLESLPVC